MGARAKKTSTKKRKEKRVRKKKMKRGMTKFSFVTQPRHFVLHIPNTPPHHHLCSRNKARRDRLRQFEKNPNPTREMPDQSLSKTTEHPLQSEKKINPRDGVFSQTIKQKNESFLPPLKTDEKKKFPLKIERKTLCIILFL